MKMGQREGKGRSQLPATGTCRQSATKKLNPVPETIANDTPVSPAPGMGSTACRSVQSRIVRRSPYNLDLAALAPGVRMKRAAVGSNFVGFLDRVVPDGARRTVPDRAENRQRECGAAKSSTNWKYRFAWLTCRNKKVLSIKNTVYTSCDGGGAFHAALLKRHVLKLQRYILKDIGP